MVAPRGPRDITAPRPVAVRRRIPATTQGVERTVVLAFVGIRTFDLVQTAIALSTGGLAASTAPALDLTLVALVTVE
ncbi:hypothetical protein EV643_14515 [Kribbella sp. VKM Ac-2527]|uniref:Uncharacterized protein n=1 Tax=Kribbella caucasensis TaxID=2512215 RepID=A0A4R6J4F6_9ACTN|nr:hypothetical protein EV643_14515 [Kribbella sp. VKM Ac-2527]